MYFRLNFTPYIYEYELLNPGDISKEIFTTHIKHISKNLNRLKILLDLYLEQLLS